MALTRKADSPLAASLPAIVRGRPSYARRAHFRSPVSNTSSPHRTTRKSPQISKGAAELPELTRLRISRLRCLRVRAKDIHKRLRIRCGIDVPGEHFRFIHPPAITQSVVIVIGTQCGATQ